MQTIFPIGRHSESCNTCEAKTSQYAELKDGRKMMKSAKLTLLILSLVSTIAILIVLTTTRTSFNSLVPISGVPLTSFNSLVPISGVPLKKIFNVAFAKTHKTGSSTLQNVFLRFGQKFDLNFAFPAKSWIFDLNSNLNSSDVLNGPWKDLEGKLS